MSTEMVIEHEPEIGFEVVNRVAIVTLNRPRALNALSHEMIGRLSQVFERCRTEMRFSRSSYAAQAKKPSALLVTSARSTVRVE